MQMQMLLMLDASDYGDTKASGNGYDDMKAFCFLYLGSPSTMLEFFWDMWDGDYEIWDMDYGIWIMDYGLSDMVYG